MKTTTSNTKTLRPIETSVPAEKRRIRNLTSITMTKNYGRFGMSTDEQGGIILYLPSALVRDFRIKSGDFVSLRAQKGPALHLRFFRKVRNRWLQLLPNGKPRVLLRRPVTQYLVNLNTAGESPTPRQRRRIEAAITTQISHYSTCLELARDIDRSVFRVGMSAFNSEATLASWLCAPCRALAEQVPLRAIRTKQGRVKVIETLQAIAQGNYL